MEAKDRIIVALDDELNKAVALVRELGRSVGGYKIGLTLISQDSSLAVQAIQQAIGGTRINGIFYDGKFHDTPSQVAGAARVVTRLEVKMFTVHCLGGVEMMRAARQAAQIEAEKIGVCRPLVLGVTILTSLDYSDFVAFNWSNIEELRGLMPKDWEKQQTIKSKWIRKVVLTLADLAYEAKLDGVIVSPKEASFIRQAFQQLERNFLIVTPGIRPVGSSGYGQKRTDTPTAATEAGADYLVIGRPITQAPDPVIAVQQIVQEIEEVSR